LTVAARAKILARDEPPREPVAAARNPPPKVVTIGTPDATEALIRHGELCALEGRPNLMGLASIAAPADARAAEIARGRPADATLH
jgi:hypothetical protein